MTKQQSTAAQLSSDMPMAAACAGVLACVQAVEATGNKVVSWQEALKMGASIVPADPPTPDDLSTIMCKFYAGPGVVRTLGWALGVVPRQSTQHDQGHVPL